jgi:predicted PurR-regulated permease PerM
MNRSWPTPTRFYILTLILIILTALSWRIKEMIGPLIIAGLIAYILNPAVTFLEERTPIRHKLGVALVYFVALGLLVTIPIIVVPPLISEIQLVTQDVLSIINRFETFDYQPIILGDYVINIDAFLPRVDESMLGVVRALPENTMHFVESLSRNTAWLLVILVTIFYLLLDWDNLREWLICLSPESYRLEVRRVYLEIKKVWAAYLRGQFLLMFIVAVVFSIIWLAIGLPGALILGIITGLFSLIPEIGPLAATVLAIGVAWIEGSNFIPLSNTWFAFLVFLIYVVLINFKNIWLRPRIMGRSVHMNEGIVFVAIIAAVMFSGVLGALIIIPVLASAGVIGRYIRARILGLQPFGDEISAEALDQEE